MPTKEYLKAQSEGVNQIAISLQQQQRDQQNHGPGLLEISQLNFKHTLFIHYFFFKFIIFKLFSLKF